MTEAAELAEAEAGYLEALAEQLRRRAQEIREVTREDQARRLVDVLEGLPFKPAKSGKCDWVTHDQVPAEVFGLFDAKGDFKTEPFHYRKMPDGNVLRFRRGRASMTQPMPHPEDQFVKLADPKSTFGPWVCVVCVLKHGPTAVYRYHSIEGARGHVLRLHSSQLQEDLR